MNNRLSVAAIALSSIAIVLSLVALSSGPAPVADPTPKLNELGSSVKQLVTDAESGKIAAATAKNSLTSLRERVDKVEEDLARAAKEPGVAVDREAIRDAMREEMREQFERMRGRGERTEVNEDLLTKQLGVEAEKAKRVMALREEMGEGIRNIWRENKGGDRDGNMKLMNEMRQRVEKEMGELLTPEQRDKLRDLERGGRGGRGRRGGGGFPGGRDREGGQRRAPAPAEDAPVF